MLCIIKIILFSMIIKECICMNINKVFFLDRDGIINIDKGYVS